ncbi:MAG: MATE family efflux transporter [Oscillospiraceae bacterium]|nr:MATE family efflux transporter [Oscillospiraceae bacterium]
MRTGTKKTVTNMTEGNIFRHIALFALPLLAGNLFQQLYNTVDTWVVGNFVGSAAFSAVGTVSPITNTLIGVFTGLSSGAGVVISQRFGGGNMDGVRRAVHTAILATLIMGLAFTALGIGLIPFFLRIINMPADVAPEATVYLRIYFAGIAAQLLYNMGAAILRAVGNSRQPFYFLVLCACMNIVLDLLFVIGFHMGVAGVAWATILSQAVSAILCIIVLMRAEGCVRLELPLLHIHRITLKSMVIIGLPTALQMGITAFSNIFVQSYINFFGSDCMGGWTAFNKIDQLIFLPAQSIGLAVMTFVGQNLGAGQVKRAKQGVTRAFLLSLCINICISTTIYFSAPALVRFFIDKEEVLYYGVLFLRNLNPFYVVVSITQTYSAALRGAGRSKSSMFITLFSYVVFRQIYLFVMANFIANEALPIAMGYPAGWVLAATLFLIVYHRRGLENSARL